MIRAEVNKIDNRKKIEKNNQTMGWFYQKVKLTNL